MDPVQSFANHRRLIPSFHGFVLLSLLVNVGYSLWHLVWAITHTTGRVAAAVSALVAVALLRLALHVRAFATGNQDRLIRVEMRARLERALPADLRPRAGELTLDQLIALRFASDQELPGLVRKVLDEKIDDRTTIKKMVTTWQADWLRV